MEIRIAVQPEPDNPGATAITVDHNHYDPVCVIFRIVADDGHTAGESVHEMVEDGQRVGISYKSHIIEPAAPELCQTCGGTGAVTSYGGPNGDYDCQCPDCNGSGKR